MSKTLHATVQNGRFIIEDPATDYPEGTQLELLIADGVEEEDHHRLETFLERSIAEAQAGEVISQEALWAELGWKK